ncbi:hypothetical protein ACQP2K_13425 [Microbispora siamensis]
MQLCPQVHARRDHLNLGEPPQPPLGQRHLLLHHRAVERGHRELVRADPEVQRVARAHPGQRLPQRAVDVDVGRPPVERLAVQGVLEQVEPGVHAASGGERLERAAGRRRT